MAFKDIGSLESALKAEITSAMHKELGDVMKQELASSANANVYSRPKGKTYQRREGLGQEGKYTTEGSGDMSVSVFSEEEFYPYIFVGKNRVRKLSKNAGQPDFAWFIDMGGTGDFEEIPESGYIREAYDTLESGLAVYTLAGALSARGLKVKL